MAIRDLIPWRGERSERAMQPWNDEPVSSLQKEINRLFEDFFGEPFGMTPWQESRYTNMFNPKVNLSETDKEIEVTAELPGMDEKDIQVTVGDGVLTLSGEKSESKQEKNSQYHRVERRFGSFRREIPLPTEVEPDKVEAVFQKGVLTITLPKLKQTTGSSRTITIKKG